MKDLLLGVLQGDEAAAAELVKAIYEEPDMSSFDLERTKSINLTLPADRFGIWVDPLGEWHFAYFRS
jgi:hypothetical protein